MSHEIDLNKYNVYTDLAVDVLKDESDGVKIKTYTRKNVLVTETIITKYIERLNKEKGIYITIEFEDITDYDNRGNVIKIFASELKRLITECNMKDDSSALIIGLGNVDSTPDALGPMTIDEVIVTNHLFEINEAEDGFRKTFAFKPGVTGETGIETSVLIKGIVEVVKPDFVITIDSLKSQSIERVNRTIQMTNTGIRPGSGVGNARKEISKEILNIPVISIGVPTVVDANVIVADTIDYMYKHYAFNKEFSKNPISKLTLSNSINYLDKNIKISEKDKKSLFGVIGSLSDGEVKQLMYEVLTSIGYNLMVTPKEIDFVISKMSSLVGEGLNSALHRNVN